MKRANSSGSLYQDKHGRWYAAITLDDGSRVRERASDKLDAETRLARLRKARDENTALRPTRLTVAVWAKEWLSGKGGVEPSSLRVYRECIGYLLPHIGHIRLAKLTAANLRTLYATLEGRLAPKTVHGVHGVVHMFLKQAVEDGLLPANVADRARPKSRPLPQKKMVILTPEQGRQFIDALDGDRYQALFLLLLYTGIRIGEGLALRWSDLDLKQRVLKIERSTSRSDTGYSTSGGKTAHARRTLVLPDALVAPLEAHKKRQNEERLRMGVRWTDLNLVFPNTTGGLSRHSSVVGGKSRKMRKDGTVRVDITGSLSKAILRAGLPHFQPHDLRHTFATRLLEAGVPLLWVSRQLGHAKISITADLYVSTVDAMMEGTAAAASKIFDRVALVADEAT